MTGSSDEAWVLVPREPTEAMLQAPDGAGVGLYSREVFSVQRAASSAGAMAL
jgi:hypothetical protein